MSFYSQTEKFFENQMQELWPDSGSDYTHTDDAFPTVTEVKTFVVWLSQP